MIGTVQRRWRGPPRGPHHRGLPVGAERMVGPEYCPTPIPTGNTPWGAGLWRDGKGEGPLEKALGQAGVRRQISGLALCANPQLRG